MSIWKNRDCADLSFYRYLPHYQSGFDWEERKSECPLVCGVAVLAAIIQKGIVG
jgi:hypothetical protein